MMASHSAADRSSPEAPSDTPPTVKPHGELGCHDGYKLLSTERPTVYCSCTLGLLAKSMDDDPLDAHKAERWERVCRSRKNGQRGRYDPAPTSGGDAR